ncbi:hypothetical protein OGATHE_000505 [Ogataea polymorpha]|uniref:Uncharacterized protein n=1 Tax=Ogataea polymorpha TaxID=460523 RepID=A0A9P8TGD2_9ASCO|nr:hypothetical protein OGATHE_000505 [Ogataea polymorpha]
MDFFFGHCRVMMLSYMPLEGGITGFKLFFSLHPKIVVKSVKPEDPRPICQTQLAESLQPGMKFESVGIQSKRGIPTSGRFDLQNSILFTYTDNFFGIEVSDWIGELFFRWVQRWSFLCLYHQQTIHKTGESKSVKKRKRMLCSDNFSLRSTSTPNCALYII